MTDNDTELLVAVVTSLLNSSSSKDATTIFDALIECDGDAQAAASLINSRSKKLNSSPIKEKKRKRNAMGLDAWLNKPPSIKRESANESDSDNRQASGSSPAKKPRSSSQAAINLMDVLKQAPASSTSKKLNVFPPLTLATPALVAQHTPCTLHLSVLPAELACELFHAMLHESQTWSKNKWWLFDRVVESPHLTSFYAREDADTRKEEAQYWYNGRKTALPKAFLPKMEEACQIIEDIVNTEIRKRKRFLLEWGGLSDDDPIWRANVAAANCYRGSKESVGFHSDQLTYLGPYPTIASLSLGAARTFRLREVIPTSETRSARTFNVPLSHNSLTIMHASCQERFKHSIPPQSSLDLFHPPCPPPGQRVTEIEPSNCRINITFRFYRPDFKSASIPNCHCGIPMVLRADMKNRTDGETDRYWWSCYAGAQNEGNGCDLWKLMDMEAEGRGPTVGSTQTHL